MINKEYFFKGFKSILAHDSPAIALGCCFVAIGALLKNLGFNIQESIFSSQDLHIPYNCDKTLILIICTVIVFVPISMSIPAKLLTRTTLSIKVKALIIKRLVALDPVSLKKTEKMMMFHHK